MPRNRRPPARPEQPETAAMPSACTEMPTPPKAGPGTAGILPARSRKARCRQGRRARPGPGGAPQCPATAGPPPAPNGRNGSNAERLYRNAYPAEGGARDRGHPARTFAPRASSAGRRGRAPRARRSPATAGPPPAPNSRNGSNAERRYRNAYPAEGGARDRGHPARTFPQGAMSAGKTRPPRARRSPAMPRNRRPPPAPNGRNGSNAERPYRNAYPAEGGARDHGHPARTFPQGAMSAGKRGPPFPAQGAGLTPRGANCLLRALRSRRGRAPAAPGRESRQC